MTIFLFDIDGTLIEAGGAGGGALLMALEEEFVVQAGKPVELHGRTDLGIFTELLETNGLSPTRENFERLCEAYHIRLPHVLHECDGRVLPGVFPLLQELSSIASCHLGLLTGNLPKAAQAKLQHYELWDYFAFGIYGDLAAERPLLSKPALARVAEHVGEEVPTNRIIVIGDTPLDVQLAKTMGARCIAVCTGGYTEEELFSAGAQHILPDLSDLDAILHTCFAPEFDPPTKDVL